VTRALISAIIAFLLTLPQPTAAEDLSSWIVGVWKMTSFTRKQIVSRNTSKPFGEHPVGMVIYIRPVHFVAFVAGQDRQAPVKPDPTDGERIELFKTMYGYGGTYKVCRRDKRQATADLQDVAGPTLRANAIRRDRLPAASCSQSPLCSAGVL
jgi:hypothetical protein